MPDSNSYFEILHLSDRVELRPSPRLIRNKSHQAGCLFVCFGPVVFYLVFGGSSWRDWLICIGSVIPIWLLVVYVNHRLRRQAAVPLIISAGPHVKLGESLISTSIEFHSVQLAAKENYDNPDTFNVLLVPATGEPVTLPRPYFGDLDFEVAVLLANDVAKLLQIPLKRELWTESPVD